MTVTNEFGLHARPAARLVHCAMKFKSKIVILANGKRYPADRIMEVLVAGLKQGVKIILEAEGVDADEAVETLELLLAHLAEEDRWKKEISLKPEKQK